MTNSLCSMLQKTPFHRENYCRLILAVVIQFYQRCSDRYHALTMVPFTSPTGEQRSALGATWAQRSEMVPCLTELLATPVSFSGMRVSVWVTLTKIYLSGERYDKAATTLSTADKYRDRVTWPETDWKRGFDTLCQEPIGPCNSIS